MFSIRTNSKGPYTLARQGTSFTTSTAPTLATNVTTSRASWGQPTPSDRHDARPPFSDRWDPGSQLLRQDEGSVRRGRLPGGRARQTCSGRHHVAGERPLDGELAQSGRERSEGVPGSTSASVPGTRRSKVLSVMEAQRTPSSDRPSPNAVSPSAHRGPRRVRPEWSDTASRTRRGGSPVITTICRWWGTRASMRRVRPVGMASTQRAVSAKTGASRSP